MFPEKSCISLAGRHRSLGTPNTQRHYVEKIVVVARKPDHPVKSKEKGGFKTNFQNASSLALPLLAVALVSQPASVLASDLALDSKVTLKRDVVEDMLIQRFRNRIHGVSDEELAQITERLLAEQATFPTDLLLISPSPGQKQQQTPAPPARKVTIDASKASEQDDLEEEDDDTAELLATLSNVAAEGVTGAAASTVSDAITSNWAPQIPRIARAVGIGAGLAATVPAASAIQRRMGKKKNATKQNDETISTPAMNSANEAKNEASTSGGGGGIGGFLSWAFGDDIPETQKPEISSPAATSSSNSSNDGVPATAAAAGTSATALPREEIDDALSSNGGQVLWKRKDDADTQQSFSSSTATAGGGEGGAVLWRRSEKVAEEKNRNTSSNGADQQQDLWRMPLDSLKSPGNIENVEDRASNLPPKPVAPSPRPVPVVEKSKIVNGFSAGVGPPKLSESALDNAEPPDFVANGVHKL